MTTGRDDLSKAETVTVAAVEGDVPHLVEAQEIITAFQAMIRRKSLADFEPWLARARSGLITQADLFGGYKKWCQTKAVAPLPVVRFEKTFEKIARQAGIQSADGCYNGISKQS